MSRRITLTNREIWHIVQAITALQKESAFLTTQVTRSGNQALQDIVDKLQPHHQGK